MASRFSSQMSGQMAGWPDAMRVMSRKPPAARRSRAACSSARSSASVISVAAGEVGHVAHHGDEAVVALGGEGHHLGAEAGHDRRHRGEHGIARLGRRREHPDGALEQVGVGAVEALLLGAGHRVAAEEAGVVDGGHDRGLHACRRR